MLLILIDVGTREPVKGPDGGTLVQLQAVPGRGDLVSFASRSFEVQQVWHVHEGLARLLVTERIFSDGQDPVGLLSKKTIVG
jgi:hypothetical protein